MAAANAAMDDTADHPDILVHVEVCLKPESRAAPPEIAQHLRNHIESAVTSLTRGLLELPFDSFMEEHVQRVRIDFDARLAGDTAVALEDCELRFHPYYLHEGGPDVQEASASEGAEAVEASQDWTLPALEFEGLWESLVLDSDIQSQLVEYANTAVTFGRLGVDPTLVSVNRVVLLHGPPGTGKTTLCKALAQKLAIRLGDTYSQAALLEVNAHSLFSRWFSESGKLVARMFQQVRELVADGDSFVFVLIDEVESLTAARKAAVGGNEPSDALRVVNALLTQLDALRQFSNVMVLTTSNITEAVDVAFVDRADIKQYIGLPSASARYEIFRSCVHELLCKGVIPAPEGAALCLPTFDACKAWLERIAADQGVAASSVAAATTTSNGAAGEAQRGALSVLDQTEVAAAERDARELATALAAAKALATDPTTAVPPPGVVPEAATAGAWVLRAALAAAGLSGRALRKLPLQAQAWLAGRAGPGGVVGFSQALRGAVGRELEARAGMRLG